MVKLIEDRQKERKGERERAKIAMKGARTIKTNVKFYTPTQRDSILFNAKCLEYKINCIGMEEIEAFKVVLEARVKIYAKREEMKGKVNILKSLFWTFSFTLIPVICF